jgi:vacuolar protein sorting-associated protein 26
MLTCFLNSGKVNITLHRKTGRLEHQGIRIEFIGLIELYYDRGNHHEFLSLVSIMSSSPW